MIHKFNISTRESFVIRMALQQYGANPGNNEEDRMIADELYRAIEMNVDSDLSEERAERRKRLHVGVIRKD